MVSQVLKGGPSDHDPFVQTFKFAHFNEEFTAVTYNVEHGNGPKQLNDIFDEIARLGTSVYLLQEVKKYRKFKKMLRRLKLKSRYSKPEFCIAWDPKIWKHDRTVRRQMSPTKYWTINYAQLTVLEHKKLGLKIKFMTYHPPAHVQAPRHKTFPVVSRVLREVVRRWNHIAERSITHIYACLFGGDDNVDETKGYKPPDGWDFMTEGPLEQVRPLTGTHGARIIDEFRKTGRLIAVREG